MMTPSIFGENLFDEMMDFSWDKEMDEFYEAVTNQKPIVHGTMDDAVKTMQIVTDIYKLAEKKG